MQMFNIKHFNDLELGFYQLYYMFSIHTLFDSIVQKNNKAFFDLLAQLDTKIEIQPINKVISIKQSRNSSKVNNIKKVPQLLSPSRISGGIINTPSMKAQKILNQRKRQLLEELRTIDHELRKVHQEKGLKQPLKKRLSSETDEPALFEQANEFVHKMNLQRKKLQQERKRKNQALNLSVQKSLRSFKELSLQKDQELEHKRKIIEQRIQERHKKTLEKLKINRYSNNLIHDIQNYKVSLPIATDQLLNPEAKINRQTLSTQKDYPKSIFLQNIERQETLRKRQAYLKISQKKAIRERQNEYSIKVRRKIRKNDEGVFLT